MRNCALEILFFAICLLVSRSVASRCQLGLVRIRTSSREAGQRHLQLNPAAGRRGGGALHVGMPELGHRHLAVWLKLSVTEILAFPDLSRVVGQVLPVPPTGHLRIPCICAGDSWACMRTSGLDVGGSAVVLSGSAL